MASDPTVLVGLNPIGVAINPAGTRAYVADNGSDTVSVIDATANSPVVIATVVSADLQGPWGVAVTPNGALVLVTNQASSTVSLIDAGTNAVTGAPINVGSDPLGVAINPAGTRAYVANAGSNTVSVIDLTTTPPAVITTPTVGSLPQFTAVSPSGTQIYVTNAGSDDVTVLGPDGAVLGTTAPGTVGSQPFGVAFLPDGTRAYITNYAGNSVTVLDATVTPPTQITTIIGFHSPVDVAVSPDGTRAYITNYTGNSVGIIDTGTNTVVDTLPIADPAEIAVTPDGNFIYVTQPNLNQVSVLPARTVVTSIIPSSGSTAGGELIAISGSGFTGATAVTLNSTPVEAFTVSSDTLILATTPPHTAGTVHATVTTPLGTATGGTFTYTTAPPTPPAITGICPASGSAGASTQVSLTGTGLSGATSLTVDGSPVPFTVVSDHQITATLPPHASGTVTVAVTTPNGTASIPFTYTRDRTLLTATPAIVQLIPPQPQAGILTATLTDLDTGRPLPGQTITFTTGTTSLGSATTNAQGTAVLNAVLQLPLIILNGGYTATYPGSSAYQSATAHAGLITP